MLVFINHYFKVFYGLEQIRSLGRPINALYQKKISNLNISELVVWIKQKEEKCPLVQTSESASAFQKVSNI